MNLLNDVHKLFHVCMYECVNCETKFWQIQVCERVTKFSSCKNTLCMCEKVWVKHRSCIMCSCGLSVTVAPAWPHTHRALLNLILRRAKPGPSSGLPGCSSDPAVAIFAGESSFTGPLSKEAQPCHHWAQVVLAASIDFPSQIVEWQIGTWEKLALQAFFQKCYCNVCNVCQRVYF